MATRINISHRNGNSWQDRGVSHLYWKYRALPRAIRQYFQANGVAVDDDTSHKRRAILISVIGAKAYDVLSDLCSPTSPSAKSYTELSTILKSHFAPKRLVIAERYRLPSCNQAPGETVSTFVAKLALSMETAEKDFRELSTSNTTASNQPVNKVTGKPGRRFNKYENLSLIHI